MPSCTLPSLSGKVATSVAQLTEEVKQRNFYIYAYSIKLAYMTSIGTPCHFPPIGKAFFQVFAYALTVSSSVTGFGLTFATTLLICFVENNNAAMATSIARSTSTTELAVKLYKSGFLLPA